MKLTKIITILEEIRKGYSGDTKKAEVLTRAIDYIQSQEKYNELIGKLLKQEIRHI